MLDKLLRVLEQTPTLPKSSTSACSLCAAEECIRCNCGVCFHCQDCENNSLRNRRAILDFIDAALSAHTVDPEARLKLADAADDVFLDRRMMRVDQLRTMIAQQIFSEMMSSVLVLLQQMNALQFGPNDCWSRMFMLLHDLREIFARAQPSASLAHEDFGRLCEVMNWTLSLDEPEVWIAIPVSKRPFVMRALRKLVAHVLASANVGFLGEWGQRQMQLIVASMV